jgi:hypothetical protein
MISVSASRVVPLMEFVEQTPKHFAERSDVLFDYPPTLLHAARRSAAGLRLIS